MNNYLQKHLLRIFCFTVSLHHLITLLSPSPPSTQPNSLTHESHRNNSAPTPAHDAATLLQWSTMANPWSPPPGSVQTWEADLHGHKETKHSRKIPDQHPHINIWISSIVPFTMVPLKDQCLVLSSSSSTSSPLVISSTATAIISVVMLMTSIKKYISTSTHTSLVSCLNAFITFLLLEAILHNFKLDAT